MNDEGVAKPKQPLVMTVTNCTYGTNPVVEVLHFAHFERVLKNVWY